jgi:hypothetical protein
MRFTVFVVAALWSIIGLLVASALALNRNQDFNFMGPTPVSRPDAILLPDISDRFVHQIVLVLG